MAALDEAQVAAVRTGGVVVTERLGYLAARSAFLVAMGTMTRRFLSIRSLTASGWSKITPLRLPPREPMPRP